MNTVSYRAYWRERIGGQIDAYRQAFAQANIAEDIATSPAPDRVCGDEVMEGLELLYAKQPDDARRRLERCVEYGEKLLVLGRLSVEPCKDEYPLNQARLVRDIAISHGLLTGETDVARFVQASVDFESWTKNFPRFDAIDRAYYMSAVRCALLAGEYERAQKLVKAKWTSLRRHDEGAILKALSQKDEGIAGKLEEYVDRARAPQASVLPVDGVTHALELVALREQLLRPGEPINWRACVEQVAE